MKPCTNAMNNCTNVDNKDRYRVITDGSRPWYENGRFVRYNSLEDTSEAIENIFDYSSIKETIPIPNEITYCIESIYPDKNGRLIIPREYLAAQDSCSGESSDDRVFYS
jgi:hypothetical protein